MITTVLRKMEYDGIFIYVLQYNYTFQYLFAWNNEIYRQEIIITPSMFSWQRWLCWLGCRKNPYSQYQLERGEQIILSGAISSLDLLKQDKSGAKRRKAKKKSVKCQWQARADDEGKPIYFCLTHNKIAPLENNPYHN